MCPVHETSRYGVWLEEGKYTLEISPRAKKLFVNENIN